MILIILLMIVLPSIAIIYSTTIDVEYKQKSWINRVEPMKPEPMNRHTNGGTVYPESKDGLHLSFTAENKNVDYLISNDQKNGKSISRYSEQIEFYKLMNKVYLKK